MRVTRSIPSFVATALAVAALSACGNGSSGAPGATPPAAAGTVVSGQTPIATIHESDSLMFQPAAATVPAGGVVEWINSGTTPHNVAFDNGPASATMGAGDTYEVKFSTPGTYHYVCTFHQSAGMTGTITVN